MTAPHSSLFVQAPVYSHVVYDIVEGENIVVDCPDILIVEGLNVLQPPKWGPGVMPVAVSDFFDFSIYVDASPENIEQWYVDRFLTLRQTAFTREDSFFRTYASLTDAQAEATARSIWEEIIAPTRERATMIFTKGSDHRVESLRLRR